MSYSQLYHKKLIPLQSDPMTIYIYSQDVRHNEKDTYVVVGFKTTSPYLNVVFKNTWFVSLQIRRRTVRIMSYTWNYFKNEISNFYEKLAAFISANS